MPLIESLRNVHSGHLIYVFDMRESNALRSTATYRDEDGHHDLVLVADTGHAFWPEELRRGVSERNGYVPDEMELTLESVELLRIECFTDRFQLDYESLCLTLYVGDLPQARFSVAHLKNAKSPLPVRRGGAVTVPPHQHFYWELQRRFNRGRALYHVAVAYTTKTAPQ